ncbi:MAG: tyrosine-type recombinase/integrase [Proteobacteria bacterium]|nr:tyrosine-type recombinase/integrase [Pseudomonadota bacterium]MBI3497040.1 tyrosine-type recombinase/integrase [Pseudomonadota bacterium]
MVKRPPNPAPRLQPVQPGPWRSWSSAAGMAALQRLLAEGESPFGKAFLETFAAGLGNANTRSAYEAALRRFTAWCRAKHIDDPALIGSEHARIYFEALCREVKPATARQHAAALHGAFGWLVAANALKYDPTRTIRGPRRAPSPARRPALSAAETRQLLQSIDTTTRIGLRDRALIALLVYGCARIGAVIAMRIEDYYLLGKRRWLRLHEKGGRLHELPAHPRLAQYLDAYIAGLGPVDARRRWLFPSLRGRAGRPAERAMTRIDAYRMIRRRAAEAGIEARIGCHSFRATGLTAFFANGGTASQAQAIAAHASAKSTLAYDQTRPPVTLEEIERIAL